MIMLIITGLYVFFPVYTVFGIGYERNHVELEFLPDY